MRGFLCAQRSRRAGRLQALRQKLSNGPSISKVISKKICVLEIVLETTSALPDKAHKPKQGVLSKSPKIIAPGGPKKRLPIAPANGRSLCTCACWYFRWYLFTLSAGKAPLV